MAMNLLHLFGTNGTTVTGKSANSTNANNPQSLLPANATPYEPRSWATQFSQRTMTAATIQAIVDSPGSPNTAVVLAVDISYSNDGIHWKRFVTLGVTVTTDANGIGDSDAITNEAPWRFIQANITTLTGTNATANVIVGINYEAAMTITNLNQFLTIPAYPTIPSGLPPTGPAGGDLTGTYPNPTLVATGPGATGPIGSTTTVPVITIDAKGRVTALTTATISAPPGNLTGPITSAGLATSVAAQTGTGSTFVMQASPTLTTPNLGTPSAGVLTSCTGTAAGLTAGNVTTNANLTGPITSTGNATAIAAQTGTGTTFAMDTAPVLKNPTIVDTTTISKAIAFNLSGATASTTVTITSSQTANRILYVPVLSGTDTLATVAINNAFTGTNSFSGTTNAALLTSGTSGTVTSGPSGRIAFYRVGGTLQPIGSAIIQSDVGQATSGVALYVGNTPTVGATFFTSAASIGTIASTYTGVVIAGVQTSLAAVAGQVGEVITATPQTTYVSFTTTATFQAMTGTLALTPGDWLLEATITFASNGATLGNSAEFALSSTAAPTLSGSAPLNTEGLSIAYIPAGLFTTLSVFQTEHVAIRYQVSVATNVFFLGKASFSVGSPQYTASLTATRMR